MASCRIVGGVAVAERVAAEWRGSGSGWAVEAAEGVVVLADAELAGALIVAVAGAGAGAAGGRIETEARGRWREEVELERVQWAEEGVAAVEEQQRGWMRSSAGATRCRCSRPCTESCRRLLRGDRASVSRA